MKTIDTHRSVHAVYDGIDLAGFIAIHRGKVSHPAFGATRLFEYESVGAALGDALRLSRGMSFKAALAGLHYGGGKGVLIFRKDKHSDPGARRHLIERYVSTVNSLGGVFVTGADLGIDLSDVQEMHRHSNHIVGVVNDPVRHTADGILHAIEVTLQTTLHDPSIKGRTFAIQGVGKIGRAVAERLIAQGGRVYWSEINEDTARRFTLDFPGTQRVDADKIHMCPVDIFVPCGVGGTISDQIAETLSSRAIVGGANNQLRTQSAASVLHRRGIIYAPDYVVNSGGLISVIGEYENRAASEIDSQIISIGNALMRIFHISSENDLSPATVADNEAARIVDQLFL